MSKKVAATDAMGGEGNPEKVSEQVFLQQKKY